MKKDIKDLQDQLANVFKILLNLTSETTPEQETSKNGCVGIKTYNIIKHRTTTKSSDYNVWYNENWAELDGLLVNNLIITNKALVIAGFYGTARDSGNPEALLWLSFFYQKNNYGDNHFVEFEQSTDTQGNGFFRAVGQKSVVQSANFMQMKNFDSGTYKISVKALTYPDGWAILSPSITLTVIEYC